ncbi:SDR family NAD(P)-dependent oxidoreductase, partial [Amycolatopsis sp. NPDC026612]|uniref:SDR family NAD(P)-dependent oxidoreductase n=1 Tax=Amycolatopsis sp. NPDC026612 TaxID=3155466 RepID=UPI0033D67FE8
VSGALAEPFSAEYWVRHVREAVRFADGVSTMDSAGVGVFLELGPDGVLSSMVPGTAIPALRRDRDEERTFFSALAAVHTTGASVDWTGLPGHRIPLPTYAFQRERYWPEPAARPVGGEVDARFWAAVDRGDAAGLSAGTGVPEPDVAKVLPALASWRRERTEAVVTESWRYRVTWVPVPGPAPAAPAGRYAIVAAPGAARRWAEALERHGVSIIGPDELPAAGEIDGVLLVSAPGGNALADAVTLARSEVTAPLWCLTLGAVTTPADDAPGDAELAGLWGFGRALALETPDRWGGLLDIPETPDEHLAAEVWGIIGAACAAGAASGEGPGVGARAADIAPGGEDQLALRPSGLFARRLVRAPLPAPAPSWSPRGTVLITGGTGALGATVARWAAGAGAEHLVLLSRGGPGAPGAGELAGDLRAAGAEVTVLACDVSDRDELARVLRQIPPVTAVVHAAGASQATAFAELGDDGFRLVLDAKVAGARHLDELLGDDLDAFVLFSSVSGVWGSGGQTAYAAANAQLDALAGQRRARGRVATSVAWGPWAGSGMAAGAAEQDHLRRRGLRPLPPGGALGALGAAVGAGDAAVVVADVDWARFAPAFTATRLSRLLTELPEARLTEARLPEPAAVAGIARLAGLAPADQLAELVTLIRTEAAQVLGHATTAAVDPHRAFTELGFDSLTAVELRTRLAAATGLTLPPTLVFNHPNAAALAEHLRAELGDTAPSVLAELDRLEAALAVGEPDRLTRTELAVRLRTLLGRYAEPVAEVPAGELDFADDDALLEFINNDLGKM